MLAVRDPTPEPHPTRAQGHGVREVLQALATVDLRSLALFRIALAGLLVHDCLARWPDLEAFYSATGTLPVEARLPTEGGFPYLSLLDHLHSVPALRAAFCLGLAAYLLLGMGLWTRAAGVASFLFLVSLLNRNPTIRDAGDVVRLSLLTWSLFLPMGAAFSVDRWRRQRRHPFGASSPGSSSHTSVAALGILMQVGLIYLFAALAKSGSTWREGSAVYYALHVRELVTPLGAWLGERSPLLLWFLTRATWALELAALPLLMIPLGQPWLRRAAIVALAALHLGIALTMRLGPFEATMIASCLLFITGDDWRGLARLWARARGRAETTIAPGAAVTASGRWGHRAPNAAAAVLLALVAVDGYNRNVAGHGRLRPLPRPRFVRAILEAPQLVQDWHMFAPDPYRVSSYWMARATTAEGVEVDPLTGGDPRRWAATNSRYWNKYLSRLPQPGFAPLRGQLARFLLDRHNRASAPGARIPELSLVLVQERTSPSGHPELTATRTTQLWPPRERQ